MRCCFRLNTMLVFHKWYHCLRNRFSCELNIDHGFYNSWVTKPIYKTELPIMMSQTELLTLKFCLSRYICSSAYNQLLVAHIMLKLFLYLPPVTPKFITKSQNQKCSEFIEIWHTQYFNYADLYFKIKSNFYEIFTTC